MRRDQFEDPLLFRFADSSKIENPRVELLWTSSDLYTLLFARLSREAVSAEAFARLEKALEINIPDIFRLEAGIKRRGGVAAPKRAQRE
jgi:hypothetical protein